MSVHPSPCRGRRIAFECAVVALAVLIATFVAGQAGSGARSAARELLVSDAPPLAGPGAVGAPPSSVSAALDDNTLAAMIAAENAALSLPVYFVDLPVITR
jgi:hypothetical protein